MKHTDFCQESFDGGVRGDHVQEGRGDLPEPRCRYANKECAVVATADVVGVTDHVVHDDLLGAGLWALQPKPEREERKTVMLFPRLEVKKVI